MTARPLSRASSITSDVSVVGGPFSVKATLNGVTRRITLKEPPTWGDLEAQIRRVFGISSSVSVTYFDDDGDAITLDSDMELKELASVQRAIGRNSVKLTVQIREGGNAETQQRKEEEPIDVDAEDDTIHDRGAPAESPAEPAPAPAPSALAANDDWNMVPQTSTLQAESPIDEPTAPAQQAQLDAAHPPVVPTPATAPVVAMDESQPPHADALPEEPTVSAPVPPSEGKGKERAADAGSGAAMETDVPADAHDEELTIEQITAEMQDAIMDSPAPAPAPAPTSVPIPWSTTTLSPAPTADLPPAGAPQPHPQPAAAVLAPPLPADLAASFHRVVDEVMRAVNAMAASVTQGYERAEAERVRQDLMRDVGVLVEQLRISVTTSATVLFSQLQTETSRIVDEIRSRAAVYQHQLAVEHGAANPRASGDSSDSDSSSSEDERLPSGLGGFDDWALGFTAGMSASDKRAARKEMKRAQREWRKGAKEEGKAAKKELKGAEKAARESAKEARMQAKRARREAGREMAAQTRAIAYASATLATDTLVSVANNLAHAIAGPAPQPPQLPPRPTPAQAAVFAGDVFRTVAGQVGASIGRATGAAGPYPGSVGVGVPGPALAPAFVPAPVPTTVPSQQPTPAPMPTPAVAAPAPGPVFAQVPALAPATAPVSIPPVERFGYELRRLREMGFESGANGETLESMLERYEGDVGSVIAELVGV